MNAGWVVAGHIFLAPLLALSQPPWSGMVMMLVRGGMSLLFLLVLWVLLMLWWRRRCRAGEGSPRYFSEWFIPLLLAGLGLLLLCSQDRGSVDHLFQRVDLMLMNGRLPPTPPDVTPESWYDVTGIPPQDDGENEPDASGDPAEAAGPAEPGFLSLPYGAGQVAGETE